jgi:hypothetical protein
LVAAVALVAGCLTLERAVASEPVLRIEAVSNRADLVSGGEVLLRITGKATTLTRNDQRLARSMHPSATGDQSLALVRGLRPGRNTISVGSGKRKAELTVIDHKIGGPVIAGPQVEPWVCATEENGLGPAKDKQCNTPAVYTLHYMSSTTRQFAAYDPENPPADVATTTTDEGRSVPYIVRVERGVIDRGIYAIAVLFKPGEPWEPWAPQRSFNGKLLVPFGGDCTPQHGQGAPESVLVDSALSRGFAVLTSSLNVLGQDCNDVVSAEALMMLKEHFIEAYGPVRYTMSNGCSGGSMQQNWIAANYPDLLDGIQPSCTYSDIWITMQEAEDCHLLDHVFDSTSPHLWLVPAQQAAVSGHAATTTCRSLWDNPTGTAQYARTWFDPDYAEGCGLSADLVYSAESNPKGVRCTLQDYAVAIWDRRSQSRWGPVEKKIGQGFANRPFDNVGVQYGLVALQSGQIVPEQFVDLNEKIGGLDIDWNYQAQRSEADPAALEIAYRTGRVTYPRASAKVPIMDLRGTSNYEIHTDHHSYVFRARLDQANGHHENHVLWTSDVPLVGDPGKVQASFELLDQWLTRIEKDKAPGSRAAKVLRNKPGEAVDACWIATRKVTDQSTCRARFPYYADPRLAAGAPWTDNILKCRLKPLRRDDYNVSFSDAQWDRLRKVFGQGVCDWTKHGVAQRPSVPWLSYAGGPRGKPLGPTPVSRLVSGP